MFSRPRYLGRLGQPGIIVAGVDFCEAFACPFCRQTAARHRSSFTVGSFKLLIWRCFVGELRASITWMMAIEPLSFIAAIACKSRSLQRACDLPDELVDGEGLLKYCRRAERLRSV